MADHQSDGNARYDTLDRNDELQSTSPRTVVPPSPSSGQVPPPQPLSPSSTMFGFGPTRQLTGSTTLSTNLPSGSGGGYSTGPLSPSASSASPSFVFPVRSMFQNMTPGGSGMAQTQMNSSAVGSGSGSTTTTGGGGQRNASGTSSLSRGESNASRYSDSKRRGSLASVESKPDDIDKESKNIFSLFQAKGNEGSPSSGGRKPKLSPIQDSHDTQEGSSNSIETVNLGSGSGSGSSTTTTQQGPFSAPLLKSGDRSGYFPSVDGEGGRAGRRMSEASPSPRMVGREGSWLGSSGRNEVEGHGLNAHKKEEEMAEQKGVVEGHNLGQVDPTDAEPANRQTTEKIREGAYKFSHFPSAGGENHTPPVSGTTSTGPASEAKETENPNLIHPRPQMATQSDEIEDLVRGERSHRTCEEPGPTVEKFRTEQTETEPDVGPAISTHQDLKTGSTIAKEEVTEGRHDPAEEIANSRPSEVTGIVRLGQVGDTEIPTGNSGQEGSGSGSGSGSQQQSLQLRQRHVAVDHQQNTQAFVTHQSTTKDHFDPNAPSGENDEGMASDRPTSAGPSASQTNLTSEGAEGGSANSENSQLSTTSRSHSRGLSTESDVPVMTVRFQHATTEDGHHVVLGREGVLAKCEDEPITTPGAVQGFGVLMVLQEDEETGDLTIRQVSENCTELLGLSPRYLFRLQCFTHILPRSQDNALRDNLDYLPDPDVNEGDTNDEGPQVFLLSGYGEPGSDDSDEPPSERTVNRRREWTCWVAAHRPSQKLWNETDDQGLPIPPPSLIILEFELERDVYNPLYPPVDPSDAGSGTESPLSGSATTTSGGRTSSQDSVSTGESTASDSTMGRKQGTTGQPSEQSISTLKSIEENTVAEHHAVREQGLMGLEGIELDLDPAEVLESTTSHAKPLRALERMRRMTRTAQAQIARGTSGRRGSGAGRRQSRRDGAGSGGVGTMDVFSVLAQINDQLGAAPDIETFLKVVVGVIKDLTQFHRCLIYSFDSQWNGQVVAELVDWSKTHDLYKGLMFPMTDIPVQARELYRINKVRLLYDRAQTTARMVLRSRSDLDYPLDMTHSYLRAMSPIHLVYLKNMGVRSSMSISIMAFGSLWGLIALHSYGNSGMRVSFPVRQMLRLLSDSISRNIERLSYAARLHTRKLISTIPTDAHPTGYIVSNADDLIQLFDADSGVLVIGDGAKILGPSSEHGQEMLLIAEFLRLKRYENMQISHNITEDFPELRSPKALDVISGLLYVPLSAKGNDFIAFLRKGQLREVHWAGKPYRDGADKSGGLEPRQSFKAWSETIAGRSRPWTDEQLETAGVLALVYGKFIEVWRQKESAMRTNQMTSILLTNASHEVRTPLNHIINYLELALDGQLDNETRDNLSRSHLASKSLLFTINDLLDLTRIESGNETAFNDPFDLRLCIQDATRVYSSEAKRRGLEFEVELDNAPDCMVIGDLRKIRTVVANLVANAVKYTGEGTIRVSCRGREPTEGGRSSFDAGMLDVEIVVSDTGRGIASEKLQAMFVTFEQAETVPHQSQTTGLGLGLAVVARIVEQLGGQLRAESEVGVGTRFYFTLLMARYLQGATEPTASTSSVPRIRNGGSSRASRSNSVGSDTGKSMQSRESASSEIDTFVKVFSASHMRASPDDDRLQEAEARMNQPGTFPVADSSWPIKPTKVEKGQVRPPGSSPLLNRTPSTSVRHSSSGSGGPGPSNSHTHVSRRHLKEKEHQQASEKKSKHVRPNTERMRILVVEDDDVNRRILERRLRIDGHVVLSDVNGQEAVDRIKADRSFDCILMDIQMPVMDGRQSAAAIRKYEESLDPTEISAASNRRVNDRIPIIAVSASLHQEQRAELAVNFDGWMLKPIDFKRMLHILGGLIDSARRQEDVFVPGQWERGGWLKVESKATQTAVAVDKNDTNLSTT